MLARADGRERHGSASVRVAGGVDDDLDLGGLADRRGVARSRQAAPADGPAQVRAGDDFGLPATVAGHLAGGFDALGPHVAGGNDLDPLHLRDLDEEVGAHLAAADDAHLDALAGAFALGQGFGQRKAAGWAGARVTDRITARCPAIRRHASAPRFFPARRNTLGGAASTLATGLRRNADSN